MSDRLGPSPVSWRERASDKHVLIDTIHRFKGLECTAVVLVEVTEDVRPDLATCLRVGCSRPALHLDLIVPREMQYVLGEAVGFADVGGEAMGEAG